MARLTAPLTEVDAALARRFPGERPGRQPVHTCYVPADRFAASTALVWGINALAALDQHAASPAALAAATGTPEHLAGPVDAHVRRVLATEPVQDLRIDLEDGYGIRADDVEDEHATAAARAVLAAAAAGTLPASYGLRPKSLDPAVRARGLRSLGLFLSTLATDGPVPAGLVPAGLVVTLPKVSAAEQVTVFVQILAAYEDRLGIAPVPLEIQIETPAAVLALPALVAAGGDRLTGLHVGTYDYSAALGVAAAHQASDHPAVELATALMQLTTAGTGVRVADGSSNILPVGDRDAVRAGWRRHADLVRRAWWRGIYQGWDLHPAQLVSRHAAVAAGLLETLPAALDRLSAYAAARTEGAVADEPATARALAGHVRRALDARLLDDAGLTAAGLDHATVHTLTA